MKKKVKGIGKKKGKVVVNEQEMAKMKMLKEHIAKRKKSKKKGY